MRLKPFLPAMVCRSGLAKSALAIALLSLLGACQQHTTKAPMGAACLPGSPEAKRCRDVVITNNPDYPESQSPQLTVQAFDPSFEAIVGRTPQLIPLATGFGFLEGPVFLKDKTGPGGVLLVTDASDAHLAVAVLVERCQRLGGVLDLIGAGRFANAKDLVEILLVKVFSGHGKLLLRGLFSWIGNCNASRAQDTFFVFISWLQDLCGSWHLYICTCVMQKGFMNLWIEFIAFCSILFKP